MMRRGFTLVELIIVVGVMAILSAGFVTVGSMLQNSTSVRSHRNIGAFVTETAERARTGVEGSHWGIHFTTNADSARLEQITIFAGESYAGRDQGQDIEIKISQAMLTTVVLANVSPHSGNGNEVVFERSSGDPRQTGVITLRTGDKTSTITITSAGLILYAKQ